MKQTELKIQLVVIIMIPLIVIGAYIAFVVNH